jgi:hypothetical protein
VKYPTGFLKNTATGRFHPILFRPAPAPSSDSKDAVQRFRSSGHHTAGFGTLDEARTWVREQEQLSDVRVIWEWDGEGIPAMTEWLSVADL